MSFEMNPMSRTLQRNYETGKELHRVTSGKPLREQLAAIDALAKTSGVVPAVLKEIAGIKPH